MKKIINPWIGKAEYKCFGCCPDNPYGLKLEFYEDGDDIVSFWKPDANYQGWVNILHGGIQAALIDETCEWVVLRKLQTCGMTMKINITYQQAIGIDEPKITIRAQLAEMTRNIATVKAAIYGSDDVACTQATCTYFTFPKETAGNQFQFEHCKVEGE